MARYDDINTPALAVVGFVCAILLFAIIVGVQALYFNYEQAVARQQNARSPNVEAANLLAEQEARLQRQGWIDREQGKIAIPIDRAMELVVEQLRSAQGPMEAENGN